MLKTEQKRMVVKPATASELQDLLSSAYGENSAIFCGEPPHSPIVSERAENIFFDCGALDRVQEHIVSDMVVAVETGISVTALNQLLAEQGQFFPVAVSDPSVRLIDLINSGDGGYLEQAFGYMRSLVLGLDVAYESGKCAKLGGRVVKNVTGFDLTKLVVGGRGVFGVPYMAHLRLFAKPQSEINFVVSKKSVADLLLMAVKLSTSGMPLSAIELLELKTADGNPTSHVLIVQALGTTSLVQDVARQLRTHLSGTVSELTDIQTLEAYPSLVQIPGCGLEVSLSRAAAATLIDQLASVPIGRRGLLRYRPGAGRFYLDCPDQETLDSAFKLVSDFLSGSQAKTGGNQLADFEPATISCSSGPYKFSSHSNRSGDAAFGQLVDRLRLTFDPLKCFNSGVTFHGR